VEFKFNTRFGVDFSLEDLEKDGFKAVFIGVGAHECLFLDVPGEELEGVRPGVDFLREVALGQGKNPGQKVVIIGGGNVAMDAARSALRLGSKEVTILYRRSAAEMPANEEEIHEALEEGVKIEYLVATTRFIGEGGKLQAVECIRMELGEPDAGGRRRPVPIQGSEFVIPCDGAIAAIGQWPEAGCLESCQLEVNRWNCLEVDGLTFQTNIPHVFAGGDAVTGAATAIEAIAAGKEAAVSIGRFIDGQDLKAGREKNWSPAEPRTEDLPTKPRVRPPLVEAAKRITDWNEVVGTFTEDQARAEASRCLACAACSECLICEYTCKQKAVRHDDQPYDLALQAVAVILAPGFEIFNANLKPELGYGRYPNVITSLEFEWILSASGPYGGHVVRPSDHREPRKIAWLQCVG
jgi:NADPH-dependent glutamate synthase beta subunit-like oxidoreductase